MNDLATLRSICAETVPPTPMDDFEVKTVPGDPQAATHQVYFIYCAGMVKIGTTSRLMRRIGELQVGPPFPSQAVLLVRGGRLTEDSMHFLFDEYRKKGEWFYLGDRLREAIKRLAPDYCQEWLEEEEQSHRDWIREEAEKLGFVLPSHGDAA